MPPEPSMPRTAASSRARYFAPRPAHPPTRMCWSTPSLMIASGSPLRVLSSISCAPSCHPAPAGEGSPVLRIFVLTEVLRAAALRTTSLCGALGDIDEHAVRVGHVECPPLAGLEQLQANLALGVARERRRR